MMSQRCKPLRVSRHAVKRWQQRVAPHTTWMAARIEVEEFLRLGRLRPTPRHWTSTFPKPGVCFVYYWRKPQVCALIVDHTVVTVVTRDLCSGQRRRPDELTRDWIEEISPLEL